jgi:hypothetical protein
MDLSSAHQSAAQAAEQQHRATAERGCRSGHTKGRRSWMVSEITHRKFDPPLDFHNQAFVELRFLNRL